MIPQKEEADRINAFKLSIQLANKAIALDLADSQSWYVLGNAHLTNFFTNNQPISELESALKAYK